MKGQIPDKVYCSSLLCLERNTVAYPISSMFLDGMSNYWCERCQVRGQLIDWAREHSWPMITFGPHTVGGGPTLWSVAMTMATDEFVSQVERLVWPHDAHGREEVA